MGALFTDKNSAAAAAAESISTLCCAEALTEAFVLDTNRANKSFSFILEPMPSASVVSGFSFTAKSLPPSSISWICSDSL